MNRLAFFTFGVFRAALSEEELLRFQQHDRELLDLARTNSACEGVAAPVKDDPELTEWELNFGVWGDFCTPRFFDAYASASQRPSQVLSIWRDLRSVYTFAYTGAHMRALANRRDWFEPRKWPTYVAWWIGADTFPTWRDACTRLEHLHDNGPTARGFDFSSPFDEHGQSSEPLRG